MLTVDAKRTALMLVDMQNDFLHPKGAYGRAGQSCEAIAALPPRLRQVADAVRAAGGLIVSTHFTLVPGRDGNPLISSHLKDFRWHRHQRRGGFHGTRCPCTGFLQHCSC